MLIHKHRHVNKLQLPTALIQSGLNVAKTGNVHPSHQSIQHSLFFIYVITFSTGQRSCDLPSALHHRNTNCVQLHRFAAASSFMFFFSLLAFAARFLSAKVSCRHQKNLFAFLVAQFSFLALTLSLPLKQTMHDLFHLPSNGHFPPSVFSWQLLSAFSPPPPLLGSLASIPWNSYISKVFLCTFFFFFFLFSLHFSN